MNIGFWVPGDPETPSGGYEYDRRLAVALDAQGHRVEFVRLDRGIPASGPWDIVIQDELAHGQLGISNRAWKRLNRAPIVALVHHLKGCEQRFFVANALHLARERAFLATADAYLFNSRDSQRVVAELLPRSARCPHLVQTPGLDAVPPADRGNRAAVPVLLSLGAVTRRKGQLRVARALESLGDLPWRWVVAGPLDAEPATTAQLSACIRRQGWESRVQLAGWVDADSREKLLADADVFVLPADYEGYGMAALEASARGLPVVAGSRGGIREVVENGTNGFLAGNQKALVKSLGALITDSELRRRLGEAGASRAHPSWDETFRSAGPFLETVLALPSSTGR